MLWILVVVFATVAVLATVELHKTRTKLAAALAPKAAKRFGLNDLRAIAVAVASKAQGETLAHVLHQLGVTNAIADDYGKYTAAAAAEQEGIAKRIRGGEEEIERIKARNFQLKREAAELTDETAAVGALVANVA